MADTFWRAEVYRNGNLYNVDFPPRATAEECLADLADHAFTDADTASVSEWEGDQEQSTNTGRHYNVDLATMQLRP